MFKQISLLTLLLFFNISNEKIELEDVNYITILDKVNYNYESVTTKDYKIELKGTTYEMYETRNISRAEFEQTKRKWKHKRFARKSRRKSNKIDRTNDTILLKSYLEDLDNHIEESKADYKEYLENKKSKYINEVSEDKISKLLEIVNSPPITFQDFWDSKYSKKDSDWEEIDSILIKHRFEFADNFSYYPTIDFQIVTDTDTITYYTMSQHTPPMPWIIWNEGNEVITYDENINKVLFDILPSKPVVNRDRLNKSVDSLFAKFEEELK